MTRNAWLMLITTWSVILFFAGRFLLKVLRLPMSEEREARTRDGILEKDA